MERISWESTYSVGSPEIDAEHKRIIEVINLLLADVDTSVRSETMSEVLTMLTMYSVEHFRSEEGLLERLEYADLQQQKEEHRQYRRKVVALCQATMDHNESAPRELVEFIRDWWMQHILVSDAKYRTLLAVHGVKN